MEDQTREDQAWIYAQKAAEDAEEREALARTDRRTAFGRQNTREDREKSAQEKAKKKEEGHGFFQAIANGGKKRREEREKGQAEREQADADGEVLPQQYDQSTSRSSTSNTSFLGGLYGQSTQSSSHTNISTSLLPSSSNSQQLNGTFGPQDTKAIYHNPWQQDHTFDESFGNNADFGGPISNSHVDQHIPSEDGNHNHQTTSTLFGNTIATWQSSPFSYVQNGQIGSPSDMTGRRTNETRISQNVRRVSDTLHRNSSRRENTEMAASMAFTSPIIDMPYIPNEITPPATSSSSMQHKTHSKKDEEHKIAKAKASALKASASKSEKSDPGTSKTTTAKKAGPGPATAKAEPPKPKSPQLTRDQEHQSHISKLISLETSAKYWSSTGHQCDVESSTLSSTIQTSLQDVFHLGSGNFAHVHRVILNGIPLARKTFQVYTPSELSDIKKEVDHVKTLSGHKHIIRLVGTYLDRHSSHSTFYILTFPVADCDMAAFLADFEASVFPDCPPDTITKLCYASGITSTNNRYTPLSALLRAFLKSTLGCMTTAIEFMHSAKISHEDIKPANMLLRHGTIYITDFGISRNRIAATQTSTELFVGHTHGWTAPEKGDGERHSPFEADVYSLGCVFMHVISLLSGRKIRKDCAEILGSPSARRDGWIQEHFGGLKEAAFADSTPQVGWVKVMDLTIEMLSNDRHARPKIENVNQMLADLGGAVKSFHGGCCRRDVGPEGAIGLSLQQTRPPPPEANGKVTMPSQVDDNPTIRPSPKQVDTAVTNKKGRVSYSSLSYPPYMSLSIQPVWKKVG